MLGKHCGRCRSGSTGGLLPKERKENWGAIYKLLWFQTCSLGTVLAPEDLLSVEGSREASGSVRAEMDGPRGSGKAHGGLGKHTGVSKGPWGSGRAHRGLDGPTGVLTGLPRGS